MSKNLKFKNIKIALTNSCGWTSYLLENKFDYIFSANSNVNDLLIASIHSKFMSEFYWFDYNKLSYWPLKPLTKDAPKLFKHLDNAIKFFSLISSTF